MSISRVASNVNANFAAAGLAKIDNGLNTTLARLSTGLRINSSADDPAGVTTAATLRSRISSLETAIQNAQEAVGFLSTVDGYLSQGIDLLSRMKDLAIQAGNNATLSASQATNLTSEFNGLLTQLGAINTNAKYGNVVLFQGAFSAISAMGFQLGVEAGNMLTVGFTGLMSAVSGGGGLTAAFADLTSAGSAAVAFSAANSAIGVLTGILGSIGVQARRVDNILGSLQDERANAIAANSNVADADLAAEITNLATAQIRTQAATAAMAQANALPQMIAQLLNRM